MPDATSYGLESTERCEVNVALTLLETEVHHELPIPGWGFGVIAFVVLVTMLLITYSIGKGRPHS